ncbi:MAG: hypothetical protein LBE67_13755 [Kocuria palustris]|nr:hypothetical protein [Kocuria palustris]
MPRNPGCVDVAQLSRRAQLERRPEAAEPHCRVGTAKGPAPTDRCGALRGFRDSGSCEPASGISQPMITW